MSIKKVTKLFKMQPEIIDAMDGEILAVRRHLDNDEIRIGTPTKSGGNVVAIKIDTSCVGNMYALLSETTARIAIASLVIKD
jgi:hypothetical protein